jgi:hypothetical protein
VVCRVGYGQANATPNLFSLLFVSGLIELGAWILACRLVSENPGLRLRFKLERVASLAETCSWTSWLVLISRRGEYLIAMLLVPIHGPWRALHVSARLEKSPGLI